MTGPDPKMGIIPASGMPLNLEAAGTEALITARYGTTKVGARMATMVTKAETGITGPNREHTVTRGPHPGGRARATKTGPASIIIITITIIAIVIIGGLTNVEIPTILHE